MLRVSNIAKSYGTAVILDNVSFTLNEGERVGLIGPNGCGKSTLLRIITGQELPDRGAVQFDPPGLRVGYLEQGLEDEKAETVEVFIKGTQAELNAVEARVASLAAALSEADGSHQTELLHAYGEALEVLESLARSIPEDHEIAAVLEALGLENSASRRLCGILSGGQKTAWGWPGCSCTTRSFCSSMSRRTTWTSARWNGSRPGCELIRVRCWWSLHEPHTFLDNIVATDLRSG
jgi:ATPase subunit of ABC transporter with duplicated ATPase domains